MNALDRDAARKVIDEALHRAEVSLPVNADGVLTLLEACVRPVPAQTIDRDALMRRLYDYAEVCGIGEDDPTPGVAAEILALLRPVEGVVFTPEEAQRVLTWRSAHGWPYDDADDALAERLEAAS